MDPVGEVVLLTDISSLYSDVPDLGSDELLEAAQAASSSYYSALKAEELARKKLQRSAGSVDRNSDRA